MGLAFQFPIVITILLKFNVIQYKNLVNQRIIAYTAALVFAALLPPTDLNFTGTTNPSAAFDFRTNAFDKQIPFQST
jgi:Sec-independent protein secretion pathway component TatC